MPNLKDIRRRIRSVKNTQQITKAMKMVSAARLRRAQERVVAARPYAATMTRVLENLSGGYLDPVLGGGVKEVAPFVVLVIILMLRPYGLFGKVEIERV